MTDEQTTQTQEETQNEAPNAASPFVDELTKLGKHFSQLVKDALESPGLQDMRKEVASGAQGVIDEINQAMNKARSSKVTQDVAQKATRTAESVKGASVSENLKSGLLNVMKSVNKELSNLVQRMEEGATPPEPEQTDKVQDSETL